jgi:hypothetical protein
MNKIKSLQPEVEEFLKDSDRNQIKHRQGHRRLKANSRQLHWKRKSKKSKFLQLQLAINPFPLKTKK